MPRKPHPVNRIFILGTDGMASGIAGNFDINTFIGEWIIAFEADRSPPPLGGKCGSVPSFDLPY